MATTVEQIKEKVDIAELVSSYIRLEKAGVNFKASCPFHTERTPSFYVTPSRQIWHCFGCNKGGDIFRFVMEIEGVEFSEALRMLAEKAGVEIHREDPRLRTERTRLLDCLEEAVRFYERNLYERKDVGAYLKERGMTGETAKSFRVGYAKNSWNELTSALRVKGFRGEEMEKAGLAIRSERDAGWYDRFRGRIMFPLFDATGRAVGFSARIFEKDLRSRGSASGISEAEPREEPKYINTPQTILYDKSRILYGFDRAKTDIRKQNACIVLEGQMDLILSHQAGVTNAVAVSGTALTPFHLTIIKRLADTLILSFDSDAAGFEATAKSVHDALRLGFDVKVVRIDPPAGGAKDPADLIRENPELWRNALSGARPIVRFFLETLGAKYPEPRVLNKEVVRVVLPFVAGIASGIDRAHWVGQVAAFLNVPEDAVWQDVRRVKSGKAEETAETPEPQKRLRSRRDLVEERLIGFAAWKGQDADFSGVDPAWFCAGRRPFFEQAKTAAGGAMDHYLKKLALEAEIMCENAEKIGSEIQTLGRELRREGIKERLLELAADMRLAERSGQDVLLQGQLEEFKTLTSELNRLG
ncbi:MAG: DNA primase [Candidatus Niyogibacteria bacterium]|nr:DNA primase [Candidatus Niyogibacteria bacterium]